MVYRVSQDEVLKVQEEYKKNYAPFRPFTFSPAHIQMLGYKYANVLTTQNGRDTDDYPVMEGVDKVQRYLSNNEGKRVLILGVGTGREVVSAKELGMDVTGVTFGSRNIDFAIKHLGLNNLEIVEAAIECLPFNSRTFDIVAGFQVFEHAMSPLIFLIELGRVLKPGGKLILEWPPASEQYSLGANPHHQICYTPGQAVALFQKAGFTNIKVYLDDMSIIPESEYWKGEQQKMLCCEGIRGPANQEYLQKAWQ